MNFRLLGLLAALGLASVQVYAADAAALVKSALAAEAALDSAHALEFFLAADAARPNDPFILQKISKQYSDTTAGTTDVAEKQRRVEQALVYAQRSSALAPDNAECTLSIAICYGKLGLYADVRTRIEYAKLVKESAERALAQNPDYDWANHVLGRWHYEVAGLGATKRFLVWLVFGGLPEASTAKAVAYLQRAVQLAPDNSAHHIELGFAYAANHQPELAQREWQAGLALPSLEKHDATTKRRARAALAGR
ncbi:MAG: hypothetical protein KA257_07435 [Opitutaceae bacterium]|nr:hypothetical protein [Opitutaceae bacterium]MBP9912449.1 hypothetical protein [Opitutaceae bacterium]